MTAAERSDSFACFGSTCTVHVTGDAPSRDSREAVAHVRRRLLDAHRRFSRFDAGSELSRLNADPRELVPASHEMVMLAAAVREAGETSGGLVDGTLEAEIRAAGYDADQPGSLALTVALELAPERRPARPGPTARWRTVAALPELGAVARPPGVALDSGGLVKGLLADILASELTAHESFAVNCAGDLALGGTGREPRRVEVASPFDGGTLHMFELESGGVATSGIGRRAWLDDCRRPAHHLLDPASGRPAYTGVVQATALAPSTLAAEIRAKAAVLNGPAGASRWLPDGGVVVLDDGSHRVVDPPQRITLSDVSGFAKPRNTPALHHR